VLGSSESRQLTVLCFRSGRLVAVESCNRPGDHMASRKLLSRAVSPTIAQAAAPGFDLKEFEAATREPR
jgi:3-phenylpropionate/trans-cinnamate dioxygenase ferredoxin reductase subunit